MNFRLKTSKNTAERLKQLQASTNITPNILARIAVAFSLKQADIPEPPKNDTGGLEILRSTLTGEYDFTFRALIAQHCNREISDEEYFPDLFNAHLERGIDILYGEYQHAGSYDRFIINLLREEM